MISKYIPVCRKYVRITELVERNQLNALNVLKDSWKKGEHWTFQRFFGLITSINSLSFAREISSKALETVCSTLPEQSLYYLAPRIFPQYEYDRSIIAKSEDPE